MSPRRRPGYGRDSLTAAGDANKTFFSLSITITIKTHIMHHAFQLSEMSCCTAALPAKGAQPEEQNELGFFGATVTQGYQRACSGTCDP